MATSVKLPSAAAATILRLKRPLRQRLRFAFRQRLERLLSLTRIGMLRTSGMEIAQGVTMGRIQANWPAQVRIGAGTKVLDGVVIDYCHGVPQPGPSIVVGSRCYVGRGAEFNIRRHISIGDDCLIAAGVRFIDHDHGLALDRPMRAQPGPEAPIAIGDDVWIGANVVVLKGVSIADGAVVAAGAVVTRSIPSCEIWAGVPAKPIGLRKA